MKPKSDFVPFLVFQEILILCVLRNVWIQIPRDDPITMGYVLD